MLLLLNFCMIRDFNRSIKRKRTLRYPSCISNNTNSNSNSKGPKISSDFETTDTGFEVNSVTQPSNDVFSPKRLSVKIKSFNRRGEYTCYKLVQGFRAEIVETTFRSRFRFRF